MVNDLGEVTSKGNREKPVGGFLDLLRKVALCAVAVGAVGSFGLMLRAGRHSPRFLLVLFVIWVLSPFVALAWANVRSQRWANITRATLYCVTLILTLGSLSAYGNLIKPPTGSARAFVFVAVPPASWLFMVIAVPIAALISRRLSRRSA